MLSEKVLPSPPHTRTGSRTEGLLATELQEVDLCEPVQNSLHDTLAARSARTGPSEGSHEHTLIECENKIFETGESEQNTSIIRTSESLPHTSGVQVQEDRHGVSNVNLGSGLDSKDTPRDTPGDAETGDVLHRRSEASLEIENPGSRQSPPTSQDVTPSSLPLPLPLHLIPLLPQTTPSPKRQRRSIGFPSNQADIVADDFSGRGSLPNATGTTSSPQSLRSHHQNFSAESTGISRTLAYAMDQMNTTPLCDAEPEELVMTSEAEADREGDEATRPKTVRFEDPLNTCQPAELAECLWTDTVQAIATARMHEESEPKVKRGTQSGKQDEAAICGQDATVGGNSTAGEQEDPEMPRDAQYWLYQLDVLTLEQAIEGPSKDTTSEMDTDAWCTAEGGSRTVDPEVEAAVSGSETERRWATLASQTETFAETLKPAQRQEYKRLKEREMELTNAEAEVRLLEDRLEAREKDLKIRLATVRQRLEAVRQRKASINCREEIIRQKLEAITKEAQGSANAPGADATPESINIPPEVCHKCP
ncbi:hypothetical protein EI94DRAFT_1829573 [Lactarius quietus]|nr:hypothetical protein EI94DRAFT_1829573 [Lactarius quietus]